MRRHATLALALSVLAFAGASAASANPLEALFGGLFGQRRPAAPQQISASYSAHYGSPYEAQASAYAPDFARQTTYRIPRETVYFAGNYAPGTVIVNTSERRLYFVLPGNKAVKYGIGVGRTGFAWSGQETISRKEEWPDWVPPAEMLRRRPDLPRYMAGGPENPLGARALYLGATLYRIHGSNEPETIGQAVSSGCIRMLNDDVVDLYSRVKVGTKVVVLR
jgi:lipoprotein-anchoring transpeptidase ErfK/SrfK